MAIAKAREEKVNASTLVGVDSKKILTLTQLATMEPQTLKAIMKQRLTQELNWTNYQLAKEYGKLKEGHSDINPNRYTTTVTQVLERPETARWNTVCLVLAAMGLLVQVVAINQQVYSLATPGSSS
ncbi:MAG: hypothetical protein AB4426_19560 [Xenococcaceae cyanobacterium]